MKKEIILLIILLVIVGCEEKIEKKEPNIKYKVVYEKITNISNSVVIGKQTTYVKGNNIRIDSVMTTENMTMNVANFILDKKIFSCNEVLNRYQCFEVTSIDYNMGEQNFENYTLLETKEMLGLQVECYNMSTDDIFIKNCFFNNSVLLYGETISDNMTVVLNAIEYSRDVDENIFKLPAKPKDFSKLINTLKKIS